MHRCSFNIEFDFKLTFIFILIMSNKVSKIICDNWEYVLARDLFIGYDSSIRPSVSHRNNINVTFGLALAQIIDVVCLFFYA